MYTLGTSLLCFVVQGAFETDGNLCVTSFENVLSNWTWLQGGIALDCMLRTTYLRHLYQVIDSNPVSLRHCAACHFLLLSHRLSVCTNKEFF